MEKDNETTVDGGSYDFHARIYDARLGRWLSLDPKARQFANASPYSYAGNNPVLYVDPDGEKKVRFWVILNENGEATWLIQTIDEDIKQKVSYKHWHKVGGVDGDGYFPTWGSEDFDIVEFIVIDYSTKDPITKKPTRTVQVKLVDDADDFVANALRGLKTELDYNGNGTMRTSGKVGDDPLLLSDGKNNKKDLKDAIFTWLAKYVTDYKGVEEYKRCTLENPWVGDVSWNQVKQGDSVKQNGKSMMGEDRLILIKKDTNKPYERERANLPEGKSMDDYKTVKSNTLPKKP